MTEKASHIAFEADNARNLSGEESPKPSPRYEMFLYLEELGVAGIKVDKSDGTIVWDSLETGNTEVLRWEDIQRYLVLLDSSSEPVEDWSGRVNVRWASTTRQLKQVLAEEIQYAQESDNRIAYVYDLKKKREMKWTVRYIVKLN